MKILKIEYDGVEISVPLRGSNHAYIAAEIFNYYSDATAIVFDPPDQTADAVVEFHRQRGCCDGSDPQACWERRNKEDELRMEQAKAERAEKKRLAKPWNEYEGCE